MASLMVGVGRFNQVSPVSLPRPQHPAIRHHCGDRVQGMDVKEKRQNGLRAGERDRSGEVRVVRDRLS